MLYILLFCRSVKYLSVWKGPQKKGGGEIKAKKHCSDKLGTFTDDGQMNDRNVLYKNNNKRTYSVRVLCSCGLDWIATG